MTTPYENRLYEEGMRKERQEELDLRREVMPLIEKENVRIKDIQSKYHFIYALWRNSPAKPFSALNTGDTNGALAFCLELIKAEIERVKEEAFEAYKNKGDWKR